MSDKEVEHLEGIISITIRPPIEDFKLEWQDILLSNFDNILLAREHGENTMIVNHFQCVINAGTTKNLRRKITNLLGYQTDNPVWLVIKKSNDPKYNIGYCMKEGDYTAQGIPFSPEFLDDCWQYYLANKNNKNQLSKISQLSQSWICTSINALPYVLLENTENVPDVERLVIRLFCEDKLPLTLILNSKISTAKRCINAFLHYKLTGCIKYPD